MCRVQKDGAKPFATPKTPRIPQDKVYIALFTCASTSALYLELVENMSAATFLQAFRRFTSRRGLPNKILMDNANTLKSESKEVRMISESKEVKRYFANRTVTWGFITEKAPYVCRFFFQSLLVF